MRRIAIAVTLVGLLAGCAAIRPAPAPMAAPAPKQDFFVLFFVPGTMRLSPEAEQIVRQAATIAQEAKVKRIEIAVPLDTPGGAALREGRTTAIQNILSASHVDPKLFARGLLSDAMASLPGAANRAELKLVP